MIITIIVLFLLLLLVIQFFLCARLCAEHQFKTFQFPQAFNEGNSPNSSRPVGPYELWRLLSSRTPPSTSSHSSLLQSSSSTSASADLPSREEAPTLGPFHLLSLGPGMPFSQYSMGCHWSWLKCCYRRKSLPSLLYLKQQSLSLSVPLTQLDFSSEHLLSDKILYMYWFIIYLPYQNLL